MGRDVPRGGDCPHGQTEATNASRLCHRLSSFDIVAARIVLEVPLRRKSGRSSLGVTKSTLAYHGDAPMDDRGWAAKAHGEPLKSFVRATKLKSRQTRLGGGRSSDFRVDRGIERRCGRHPTSREMQGSSTPGLEARSIKGVQWLLRTRVHTTRQRGGPLGWPDHMTRSDCL